MTRFGVIVTILVLVLLGGAGFFLLGSSQISRENIPTNNLPPPNGESPILDPVVDPSPTPNPSPSVALGCYIGGCSGEICSDQQGVASNCIYKEEFACYKTAKCEKQITGKCGWTQTPGLLSCINNSSNRVAAGYLSGDVRIGPFCPVEKQGEPCKVPPDAYTSREAIVYEQDAKTVKERVNLDTNGNYKFTLGPGNYFVQISPAGIGPGEKKPALVKSFETTVVDFDIDTGIR